MRKALRKWMVPLFTVGFVLSPLSLSTLGAQSLDDIWMEIGSDAGAHGRHEAAFVQVGSKYYLLGGRRIQPVDIYDPTTERWSEGATPPVELHHFQAVAYHGLIVVAGALVGAYPYEIPSSHLFLYDPVQDRWTVGPEIPVHRRRGAAGLVVYQDKLYLVNGIVNGHSSHWVPWLDEFDPETNSWRELPDAPRARDHFQAAVVDGRLYAASGRRSGYADVVFAATVPEVDVYDFASATWSTLPSASNIPTPRAGTAVSVVGDEVVVIGGESTAQDEAHDEVEALDVRTGVWRSLPPLGIGRHGAQSIMNSRGLFIAGGSAQQGGGPEIVALEHLAVEGMTAPLGEEPVPGSLALEDTRLDADGTLHVTLGHDGGDQAMVLTHAITSDGSTVAAPYGFPYILTPGATLELDVIPDVEGEDEASLLVKAWGSGPPVVVPLPGR